MKLLEPGTEIDGFRVVDCIHAGGMAHIYAVEYAQPGRSPGFPMAMKIPRMTAGDGAENIVSFEVELTILPVLSGPHVPRFVAAGDLLRLPYLVMEYIPGQTLQDWMGEGRGRCDTATIARLGAATARAPPGRAHGRRAGGDGMSVIAAQTAVSRRALSHELDPEGILIVTLDVPGEKVNALSRALLGEFTALIAGLETRNDVTGVILRSGKPDNFIAGADIRDFGTIRSQLEGETLAREGQALLDRRQLAGLDQLRQLRCLAVVGCLCGSGKAEHQHGRSTRHAAQNDTPRGHRGYLPMATSTENPPDHSGGSAARDIVEATRPSTTSSAWSAPASGSTRSSASTPARSSGPPS